MGDIPLQSGLQCGEMANYVAPAVFKLPRQKDEMKNVRLARWFSDGILGRQSLCNCCSFVQFAK